jgi:MarR family transcriptional regulator for hemolysin
MAGDRLAGTLFYSLERAIKTYRQFAQSNINRAGIDITIDQWLILKTLQDNPDITLQQVSVEVFKDFASVTRIIQLLEAKKYVARVSHPEDGRRSALSLTTLGKETVRSLKPIITGNRAKAVKGLSSADIARAHATLATITENCRRGGES